MEKYIPLKANNDNLTHIKTRVYYEIGSYKRARGYYLSITPVTYEKRGGLIMEGFTASKAGYYYLLILVTRKSAKAEKEAEQKAAAIMQNLIDRVCAVYDLFIEEGGKQ